LCSDGLTAEHGFSAGRLGLWVLAILSVFFVLTFAVWFFASEVEVTTVVTSPDGTVIAEESDTDLGRLVLPGAFLGGSLISLAASILALRRAGRN